MNSSSDVRNVRTRGRVLRGAPVTDLYTTVHYEDLAGVSSDTLDPTRIEVAIAAGYRDGHAEGHAGGFAAGHAEALRAAEQTAAHVAVVLDQLAAAASMLAEREAVILRSAEDAIGTAAVQLAEVLVGRELELATTPGLDAIGRVLAIAPSSGEVVVRLHPADLEGVQACATNIDERVRLVADPMLARGDAVAEWGDTILDARLVPALERARAAVNGDAPA